MFLPEGFQMMPGVGGGLFTGVPPSPRQRWAKITDYSGQNPVRYAWKEQTWQQLPPGGANSIGLADMDGGMFGTAALNPAVEPNGVQLSVGDFALVQAAYFDPVYDMVFAIIAKTGSVSAASRTANASYLLGGGATVTVAPNTVVYLNFASGKGLYWDLANGFVIPAGTRTQNYELQAQAYFSSSNTIADFGIQLFKNSDTTLPTIFNGPGSCDGLTLKVHHSDILNLAAGDTLRIGVFHNWLGNSPTAISTMATIKIAGT